MKRAKMLAVVPVLLAVVVACHVAGAKNANGNKGRTPALPPDAAAAIKKAYPQATVGKIEREKESVVLYEVELDQNGEKLDVKVSSAGQVVEVENEVAQASLPETVAKALANLAGDAKVKKVERAKILAVITVVALEKPQIVYEAEFMKDGKEVEVKIGEDGKLLGKEVDDEDEEDEHEMKVSISQIPAAVKATILREAGANAITEIEQGTKGGKMVYEAEWISAGKKTEIRIAEDGTLLGNKVEEPDDED